MCKVVSYRIVRTAWRDSYDAGETVTGPVFRYIHGRTNQTAEDRRTRRHAAYCTDSNGVRDSSLSQTGDTRGAVPHFFSREGMRPTSILLKFI